MIVGRGGGVVMLYVIFFLFALFGLRSLFLVFYEEEGEGFSLLVFFCLLDSLANEFLGGFFF